MAFFVKLKDPFPYKSNRILCTHNSLHLQMSICKRIPTMCIAVVHRSQSMYISTKPFFVALSKL